MSGYGLVVRFHLREGHGPAFDDLVSRTLGGIRLSEPGTVTYANHTVAGEPDLRIFYELYRDRAAFVAHEEQAHVREFLAARSEHVDSFDVDFLQLIDGKGVDTK